MKNKFQWYCGNVVYPPKNAYVESENSYSRAQTNGKCSFRHPESITTVFQCSFFFFFHSFLLYIFLYKYIISHVTKLLQRIFAFLFRPLFKEVVKVFYYFFFVLHFLSTSFHFILPIHNFPRCGLLCWFTAPYKL